MAVFTAINAQVITGGVQLGFVSRIGIMLYRPLIAPKSSAEGNPAANITAFNIR